MLIKTYGEHWRRDWVNWRRGKLMTGFGKNQSRKANFWKMHGVYALYSGYDLVYVGQTFRQYLGDRLKQHTKDESRERWDTFSWYGIQDVVGQKNKDGFMSLGKLNTAEWDRAENIIESLESLVIRIADPALNRRRDKFTKGTDKAERFHQFQMPDPDEELQEKMTKLMKVTKKQLETLDKIWRKVK